MQIVLLNYSSGWWVTIANIRFLPLTLILGSRSHKMFLIHAKSYHLYTCEVWSCYVQLFMRCIYEKIHYMTLTLGQGHTKGCPVSSTSCYLCTCEVFVATYNQLKGYAFTREYIIDIWPWRSHETSPTTLYITWSMHLQSVKMLRPMVMGKIQLQETWQTTDRRKDIRTTDRLW